ncbi:hypothetical protein [Actinacidiphila acididurans]|uniref:Uncharacterized protein n=1 Tax=Actinacidiphila acididurans TaxID=2784346 RepID=A0ABS2U4R9_9ACTN|nr:hypothetical protein [Actinacidiphila acididurans]MBM9509992.1 hypothetical protein [Actinacidiphila acididurans]
MPATKPTSGPDSAPATTGDDTPKTNPAAATAPKPDAVAVDEVPPGRLAAGTYEYVWPIPTQYLDVPLTARPVDPGQPAVPADGDKPETPAIPPTPATVFDWPFGAPNDGRWQPTRKKPNQVADNDAAPLVSEE